MDRFDFIVIESTSASTRKELNQMLDIHGQAGFEVVAVVGTKIIMQRVKRYPEVI